MGQKLSPNGASVVANYGNLRPSRPEWQANPPSFSYEPAKYILDGKTSTKSCCLIGIYEFTWGSSIEPGFFRYATGNDAGNRDPWNWKLEGSVDKQIWKVLHTQTTDPQVPKNRNAWTGFFKLAPMIPPPPPTRPPTGSPTTTTLHPELLGLKDKVAQLETLLASGDADTTTLLAEMKLVKDSLDDVADQVEMVEKTNREQTKALDRLAKLEATVATQGADLKQVQQQYTLQAEDIEALQAWQVLGPRDSLDDPRQPNACTAGSAGCEATIESANSAKMSIKSLGGSIVFETESCPETDLCDLSQKLQQLLGKFVP